MIDLDEVIDPRLRDEMIEPPIIISSGRIVSYRRENPPSFHRDFTLTEYFDEQYNLVEDAERNEAARMYRERQSQALYRRRQRQ